MPERKTTRKLSKHFSATIRIDPTYAKAYHNLAMSLFLVNQDVKALNTVDKAIALNPSHKDAVLLQSLILEQMGRIEEAALLKEEAEFMPETNWSESVPVN